MSLFASSSSSSAAASEAANSQVKGFEKVLALRITLQKALDVGNKFPVRENNEDKAEAGSKKRKGVWGDVNGSEDFQECQSNCNKALASLSSLLQKERDQEIGNDSSDVVASANPDWEELYSMQQELRPNWEKVVNKLHARLNFGSDTAQSKMRVFNQKIWDQVASITNDETRMIEKSRIPRHDSQRIDKGTDDAVPTDQRPQESDDDDSDDSDSDGSDNSGDNSGRKRANSKAEVAKKLAAEYDCEVYDDRPFYSMLLKTFITSASSSSADGVANIRASDLSALKKYKRSKAVVDRRASKGRKIRYVSHKKLENFMFPQHVTESSISSDRLFKSLFQD